MADERVNGSNYNEMAERAGQAEKERADRVLARDEAEKGTARDISRRPEDRPPIVMPNAQPAYRAVDVLKANIGGSGPRGADQVDLCQKALQVLDKYFALKDDTGSEPGEELYVEVQATHGQLVKDSPVRRGPLKELRQYLEEDTSPPQPSEQPPPEEQQFREGQPEPEQVEAREQV